MEKLELQKDTLVAALKTLKSAFAVLDRAHKQGDIDYILAAQDSIIQRFEYTYDSFWKYSKKFLEEQFSLEEINSPRAVFREFIDKRYCSVAQGRILMQMVDDRNLTTHRYSLEEVRVILPAIPGYYEVMQSIVAKINQ